MRKSIIFESGQKIEWLTILYKIDVSNYLCKCICGNICEASTGQLKAADEGRRSSKKSCGCLKNWTLVGFANKVFYKGDSKKKCSLCEQEKFITFFYTKGSDRFDSRCKGCMKKTRKELKNKKSEE